LFIDMSLPIYRYLINESLQLLPAVDSSYQLGDAAAKLLHRDTANQARVPGSNLIKLFDMQN